MANDRPWLKFYGEMPPNLEYPRATLYECLMRTAERVPDRIAYDCLDFTATYAEFGAQVDAFANALAALRLKKDDRIAVAMPPSPQAIICFYAANKLGVVVTMLNPLATPEDLRHRLQTTNSTVVLTLWNYVERFEDRRARSPLAAIIVTGLADMRDDSAVSHPSGPFPDHVHIERWKDLMKGNFPAAPKAAMGPDEIAAIFYSSGTTARPKAIMLSSYNFICEGMMVYAAWAPAHGHRPPVVLAFLPLFHAFGFAVCCNAVFMNGGTSILVPEFTPEILGDLITRKRPTAIAGVPALFDRLNPVFQSVDLSCLRRAASGSDTLPRAVKERFEGTVRNQGGTVRLVEGYGLTEAVSGIMGTPEHAYREGAVGIPLPDMRAKIVRIGTTEELPPGEEGELCVNGPAVMLGYLDEPQETAKVLRRHADGRVWLHTGDIFVADGDGYFYFKLRLQRIMTVSGRRVYPTEAEALLYKHPDVYQACVIGVPDQAEGERVKAVVVLKQHVEPSPQTAHALIRYCEDHLTRWSCPREVEFRETLPLTPAGKVAYTALVQEEIARLAAAGTYGGRRAGVGGPREPKGPEQA